MPVYPRWRGELFFNQIARRCIHGLSPLARGTHLHSILFGRKARFIPAGAGNSGIGSTNTTCAPVYPRWRGELRLVRWENFHKCGLSPLARGTRKTGALQCEFCGFISAGVGNSFSNSAGCIPGPVYPRWRGELINVINYNRQGAGLSPLARGTPG